MQMRNVVHFDIPTKDFGQTQSFYKDLCGWTFMRDDELDYTMFNGGNVGGGLMAVDEETKPGDVLIYLHSDDIEADVQRVRDLGGTVVAEKVEVPGNGALAIWLDPAGNRMAFWQSYTNE